MKINYLISLLASLSPLMSGAQSASIGHVEQLGRGVVAVPSQTKGQLVTWRLLSTDDEVSTTFDVVRSGATIARNLQNVTCYNDQSGLTSSRYQVVTKVGGTAVDTTEAVAPWTDCYKPVRLKRPQGGTLPWRDFDEVTRKYGAFYDKPYEYFPIKMSVGDVDGDGEYELFVKWEPSNAQPSSSSHGKAGNVYMDCYKVNFTQTVSGESEARLLWRVDLGQNVRAGQGQNHFMVYDLDGDGRAEMVMYTAPGTKDGQGNYVNQAADIEEIRQQDNQRDWRDENGKIRGGGEYLTVFEGLTGRAVHTVWYNPNRNTSIGGEADGTFNWAESGNDAGSYGHRGNCTLACVAFLGNEKVIGGELVKLPSVVMTRGYYTYAFLWAVDYDGQKLTTRWFHGSMSRSRVKHVDSDGKTEYRTYKTNTFGTSKDYTAYGQGNHNLSVADVDGDGFDEIIFGAATIDNDGWMLYSTGLGHGDALHVGDLLPDRPGLEVWRCCEESPFGAEMHDAATGEKLFHRQAKGDTGRCMAADIDSRYRGAEFWASDNQTVMWGSRAEVISENRPSMCFRIYWDGDLQDELIGTVSASQPMMEKWTESKDAVSRFYISGKNLYDLGHSRSSLSTKGFPGLQADLFGDWREELIFYDGSDPEVINVFSTGTSTNYRVTTLMHDHQYRLSVVWQNDCYSQPPHLGYYLPDAMLPCILGGDMVRRMTVAVGDSISTSFVIRGAKSVLLSASMAPDGTWRVMNVPAGFERMSYNSATRSIALKGVPSQPGDYRFFLKMTGAGGEVVTDTLTLHATDATAIDNFGYCPAGGTSPVFYDLQGRPIGASARQPGIYVTRNRKLIVK